MRSALLTFFGSVLAALVLTPSASAYDASLPYRNQPGFICHTWNSAGECIDFSYGQTYSTPSYSSYSSSYRSTSYRTRCDDPYYNDEYYYDRNGNCIQDTYYNSNNRYDDCYYNDRYCDDYNNDDVTVRVTASPSPVQARDLITYKLYVRNDSRYDEDVDVRAYLDSDTTFNTASDRGRKSGTTQVIWDNLLVRANSSKTLTLTVRVDTDVRDGDVLHLRATANGNQDDVDTDVRDDYYYRSSSRSSRSCRSGYSLDRYGDCVRTSSSRSSSYDNCDSYYNDYCDLNVRVYASPTEAREDALVTFTIQLRNDDNVSRRVSVKGLLDRNLRYYSASDSGRENYRDEVEWEDIYIGADSTRTLTLSARVDTNARPGDLLFFRAQVDGQEDEETIRVK